MKFLPLLLATLCVVGGPTLAQPNPPISLAWSELPPLPNELGVAGPFVGVHGEALIVAGGANFPQPVWETEKVWRNRAYVLLPEGERHVWHNAGTLAWPIAYGTAVSTRQGIVCMGGNDARQNFANVFLLEWDAAAGRVRTSIYPPLPQPCAYGAAALVGETVYLAGGQRGPALDSAMSNLWSLDLSQRANAAEFHWKECTPCPGPSRAFNLTVTQHNGERECLYVISGRRQQADEVQFLRDVWEYNPATNRWRQRADAPRCVMAGPAIGYGQHGILVLGGADGSLFAKSDELKDQHPGFPKEALAYDTLRDQWASAGPVPQNHVTTSAVEWHDSIVIPSGEVRPRVRSPQVWRVMPRQQD